MGTIAEKLTYLNTTKQKIKEMIGYGYSGMNSKNLLNIENYIQSPTHGITTVYNNDGSITVSGTATDTYAFITTKIPLDLTGTFTFSIQEPLTYDMTFGTYSSGGGTVARTLNAGDTSKTFTSNGDTGVNVKLENLTVGTTYNNTIYLQLEEGSTVTPFEKYIDTERFRNYPDYIKEAFLEALRTPDTLFNNLPKITGSGSVISLNDTANAPMRIELSASELTQDATPTPDSPQAVHTISGDNKVVVCGKNLFDKDSATYRNNYYINDNGVETGSSISGYTLSYIKVKPNTSYVYSGTFNQSNTTGAVYFYDNSKAFISRTNSAGNENPIIFTTPNNCEYIRFQYTISVYNENTIMINEGSTPTSYEPYVSQEADIDLGGKQLYNYFANALYNSSTTRVQTNDYISLPAGTYTISYSGANQVYAIYFDSSNTKVGETNWQTGSLTFTYNIAYKYKFVFRKTGDATINATEVKNVMLNEGTTALPYKEYIEPIEYSKIGNYEDKFIRTSGKNLFDKNVATNEALFTKTNDIFTSSSLSSYAVPKIKLNKPINIKNGQDYYISYDIKLDSGDTKNLNYFGRLASVPALTENTNFGSLVGTFTISSQYQRVVWKTTATYDFVANYLFMQATSNISNNQVISIKNIQIATENIDYEPYGSNEWYIKKNIGKVVLDGTENWQLYSASGSSPRRFGLQDNTTWYADSMQLKSNYFTRGVKDSQNDLEMWTQVHYLAITDKNSNWADATALKTWLTTHNTIVYYPLSTPTYTKITGTLETQLENVYKNMLSQKGTTNISQINNDLPFIMNVSAIEV